MGLRKKFLAYFFLLSSLIVSACATGFLSDAPVIVERSKEQAPSWTNQTAEKLMEINASLSYLRVKTHIVNLPLGIKDTQLGAVAASHKALLGRIHDQVDLIAQEDHLTLTHGSDLDAIVTKIVKMAHDRTVRVSDIYYEKLRADASDVELREYYQVYVLVELRQLQSNLVLKSIGDSLSASSKSDLKQLGKSVNGRMAKLISH